MFEPAKDFLQIAAQKYKLGDQALGALVCTRFRTLLKTDLPDFVEVWEPQSFKRGVLTVQAQNSAASSDLFLRTHDLIQHLNKNSDLPVRVTEIKIVR